MSQDSMATHLKLVRFIILINYYKLQVSVHWKYLGLLNRLTFDQALGKKVDCLIALQCIGALSC